MAFFLTFGNGSFSTKTKIWDHFSIQICPWSVGQMVSETHFGHSKVVFSPLCLRNSARDQDQEKSAQCTSSASIRANFQVFFVNKTFKESYLKCTTAFAQLTSGQGKHWATTGDEERIQTESVSTCLVYLIGALVAPEVLFTRQIYYFWIQEHLYFLQWTIIRARITYFCRLYHLRMQ